MKYIITDLNEITHDFDNPKEANAFIQAFYKEFPYNNAVAVVDCVTESAIFIIFYELEESVGVC